MTVVLDAKRRLSLPASVLASKPGEVFDVIADLDEDSVTFRRLPGKEDWIDVLSQCPVSMDDLPVRKKAKSVRRKR